MVTPPAQGTAWQLAGASLRQGQTVRTGNSAVRLEAEEVGRVDLAPNSVLRTAGGKRLTLQRGELHAFIWAPAREFVVDTPSARAVDLGCEYTLNVDEKGDGSAARFPRLGGLPGGRSRSLYPRRRHLRHAQTRRSGHSVFRGHLRCIARRRRALRTRRPGRAQRTAGSRRSARRADVVASADPRPRSRARRRLRPLPRPGAIAGRGLPRRGLAPRRRVPSINAGMRSAWRIPAGGAAGNGNGSKTGLLACLLYFT